ncbi:unnamed protein product [Phaedon cochleariae]|uniref:Kinectin n=1 Tax=Phaedon cochleariae TaxID=80249 RepID=A0A9P0GK54_PHACE|nr:unnamed protein product [Phaedon cochleariae]
MDLSTPLLFIVLFLIACFSLFLVYKYGVKQKSFEEALAEQRQQTNALLGLKPKPKEKKNKKASKKSKEKLSQENETDGLENSENNKENSQPNKLHVEFKEILEEVPTKDELKAPTIKEVSKVKKMKKVRPILMRKDKSPEKVIVGMVNTPTVNHFEENHPKDDLELMRSISKDDILKTDPIKELKEKKPATETNISVKNKKNKQIADSIKIEPSPIIEKDIEEKVEKALEIMPLVNQTNNGALVGNPGKEKKKKKSEFNTRQQLTAEKDELINSVRKAELSKTEVQLLIDLLLNKQLEAPTVISDWSEGKYDPIQKMKKQLAEKEKALIEEQEALLGAQAKLKEIRAEQQAEKAQLQQKIRGLEELAQTRHIEIQAGNNRFQVNAQKIQQLQAELNSEMIKTHKLMEDNAALQMQAQQYEVSLSQMQDTENIIGKLRSDIDELSAQNQQLRMDLQQIAAEKEHQQQHFMMQMATMDKGFKESRMEMEKNLEMALRQENDWKNEIAHLDSTLQQRFEEERKMELTLGQLNEKLRLMNNEKAESVKKIAQLTSELQLSKEEIKHLNHSAEGKQVHEVEVLNLTNELASKKSELSTKITEWQQTERKYKADLETTRSNYQKIQQDLEEQKAKNNELRAKNWKVMEALNAAESKSKNVVTNKQSEIDAKKLSEDAIAGERAAQKAFLRRLFPEIEGLEAVAAAEDWQAECGKLIGEHLKGLRVEQVAAPASTPPASPGKAQEVGKLQAQLLHYKGIIDDTEGMLNNLQKHIEREEINWRSQLAAKEAEIDHLKETRMAQNYVEPAEVQGVEFAYKCIEKSLPLVIDELQSKVISLEQQLSNEVAEKQRLLQDCQLLKSQAPQKSTSRAADPTATIEKLSEEVNRLREQLRVEQTKNRDVAVSIKAKTCSNPTNGTTFIEVPTIRNASICSNMGCQFLYCDGNNCGGNL